MLDFRRIKLMLKRANFPLSTFTFYKQIFSLLSSSPKVGDNYHLMVYLTTTKYSEVYGPHTTYINPDWNSSNVRLLHGLYVCNMITDSKA